MVTRMVKPGRTLTDVITDLRTWDSEHKPMDRTTRLPLFQFVVEQGHGGALVPLSGEKEVATLPAIYFKPHAMDQFLNRLDYPKRLAERLPNQLNILAINYLIQHGAYDNEAMFRLQDGDQMRAFMSGRFEPVDNLELLTLLEPFVGAGVLRWEYEDELTFHLSLTFPKTATAIKVGDIVEQGLHISNSEVGVRSVTVAAYVYRLKCRNGAIGGGGNGDVYRFRHVGDRDRIRQAVAAAIESVKNEALRITEGFKEALKKRISDPASQIEKICENKEMTQEMYKKVLEAFVEGKEGKSMFGVSQAFSRAAHDYKGEDSYLLQRTSTEVLALPPGKK